ncbi:hypothetical protein ACIQZB_37330, partial [Streptomyces sp. NPDC097727]
RPDQPDHLRTAIKYAGHRRMTTGVHNHGEGPHTHTADLTVEVWDEPPSTEVAGDWEADAQVVIVSLSGTLDVWGVTGGDAGESVSLGRPGVWQVRLRCAGRAAVAEQSQNGVPEGVEQYFAQFWPVRG